MSVVMKMKEVQTALLEAKEDDEIFAEPTVKLAAEGKLDELLGIIAAKEKKFLAASSTFDLHVHAALSIRILLICMSSPRRVLFHRFAGHSMCRAAKF